MILIPTFNKVSIISTDALIERLMKIMSYISQGLLLNNAIWKYTLSIVENMSSVKVTAACLGRRSERSVFRRYFIVSAEIYTFNYTTFFVYLQVKYENLNE